MFKSITFEVIGDKRLVCEGCEERIERALKTVKGVDKVRANAHNQRIKVLYDIAKIDAAVLGERIAKTGYQSRVVTPTS